MWCLLMQTLLLHCAGLFMRRCARNVSMSLNERLHPDPGIGHARPALHQTMQRPPNTKESKQRSPSMQTKQDSRTKQSACGSVTAHSTRMLHSTRQAAGPVCARQRMVAVHPVKRLQAAAATGPSSALATLYPAHLHPASRPLLTQTPTKSPPPHPKSQHPHPLQNPPR